MRSRAGMIAVAAVVALVAGVVLIVGGATSSADEGDGEVVKVVVASDDIAAGTDAADALRDGKLELKELGRNKVVPSALGALDGLSGRTFVVGVAKGDQVADSNLTRATLRGATIEVPEGTQAVSIEVPFANGGAGYIAPGDLVNVLALLSGELDQTITVLEGVQVLDVSQEVAPRVAGQTNQALTETTEVATAVPSQLTYLIAVPVSEVPRIVQTIAFHRVYLTLPAIGAEPVSRGASATDMDLPGAA